MLLSWIQSVKLYDIELATVGDTEMQKLKEKTIQKLANNTKLSNAQRAYLSFQAGYGKEKYDLIDSKATYEELIALFNKHGRKPHQFDDKIVQLWPNGLPERPARTVSSLWNQFICRFKTSLP